MQDFLTTYGYAPPTAANDYTIENDDKFVKALKDMQTVAGIPVTGKQLL